ncbi:alpha/beta hydrolase [Rhodoferax saidenbachensis]|uniref:Pimeloyl-ACP methyl ester carboxylesterase n=1 Tax=Rhodoferax saidenbachensis TaxID=1484693 RepID=A0ABU1ZSC6_9BURK|nr:alpha/beta hydrolase [Rhodoferax saidenbachensis]MDR7308451.1 pimeloyl-ACP methyl ester carboxylesterase [Rhodoferax saidenbachensis]
MANWSAWLDARLSAGAVQRARLAPPAGLPVRWVDTTQAAIRVFDSGGDKPCLVLSPDGPNVIEHYAAVIALLTQHYRVLCFDMPGFGFSAPGSTYDHSLQRGAKAMLELMDQLGVAKATLALSCANGFYAIRVAQMAPQRVERLVLSQTPSLAAMHRWTDRVVPKVLKLPLLGQLLSRVFRQKMATAWYRIALPKTTNAEPFRSVSHRALRCGGCFSLAGVVQGLLREPGDAARLHGVPCTVLWGTQDRSHKFTEPRAILHDVPHAQVVVLDNCGHFPDLEDPQRFVQALLQGPLEVARHA